MFDDLILHHKTAAQLEKILPLPSQGYLFVGSEGSGRRTVAERLARKWAGGDVGLVHVLSAEKGENIGIEAVQQMKRLLHQTTKTGQRRTLLIDNASQLTREAQNNLLKLLEEPHRALGIIALATQAGDVLPTIQSRLQVVHFYPLDQEKLVSWHQTTQGSLPQEASRLYHMGNKTPGGMLMAAESPSKTLEIAKEFLQADPYIRSQLSTVLQKYEKSLFDTFLTDMSKLVHALLVQSAKSSSLEQSMHLSRALAQLLQTRLDLAANVNQRLLLTQLVVNL